MSHNIEVLFDAACKWVNRSKFVRSAVLFGSSAREGKLKSGVECLFPDIDVHIISQRKDRIMDVDWSREIPELEFCMRAWRSASGGAKKCTVIFTTGQVDLIVVPESAMYVAKVGLMFDLHLRLNYLRFALNEMATCLHGGYKFLKGEEEWGKLYYKISRLPGVRLNDKEVEELANAALIDSLWVLQKLEAGEVVAAQHVIHSRVMDASLRLWRELRFRDCLPLPSFGLGRKMECLIDQRQYSSLCFNSLANAMDLEIAIRAFIPGLCLIVVKMLPNWKIAPQMKRLLESHGPSCRQP